MEDLLKQYECLKVDEGRQRIVCSLTKHEVPLDKINVLQSYVTGKKFQRALAEERAKKFAKFLVEPQEPGLHVNQLFCTITGIYVNKLVSQIEAHLSGRRFQTAFSDYEKATEFDNNASTYKFKKEKISREKQRELSKIAKRNKARPNRFNNNNNNNTNDKKNDTTDVTMVDVEVTKVIDMPPSNTAIRNSKKKPKKAKLEPEVKDSVKEQEVKSKKKSKKLNKKLLEEEQDACCPGEICETESPVQDSVKEQKVSKKKSKKKSLKQDEKPADKENTCCSGGKCNSEEQVSLKRSYPEETKSKKDKKKKKSKSKKQRKNV